MMRKMWNDTWEANLFLIRYISAIKKDRKCKSDANTAWIWDWKYIFSIGTFNGSYSKRSRTLDDIFAMKQFLLFSREVNVFGKGYCVFIAESWTLYKADTKCTWKWQKDNQLKSTNCGTFYFQPQRRRPRETVMWDKHHPRWIQGLEIVHNNG
jgi:hypothetical protein